MKNGDFYLVNIENIKKDFETYRRGEDNLPLTLLVASDYTDIGKQSFDRHLMREDFQEKKRDVLNRYYYNKVNQRQTPPALGYALMEKGGIERVERCFNTTMDILEGREGEYKQHPLLWKRRQ